MSSRVTPEFLTREVPFRGVTYKLRELSAGEYDALVKLATNPTTDETDGVVLNKLMVIKCLQEPTMTADELALKPYKLSRELGRAVNELHYGDEPTNGEKPAETGSNSPNE